MQIQDCFIRFFQYVADDARKNMVFKVLRLFTKLSANVILPIWFWLTHFWERKR